jgi:hypothetical protein
MTQVPNGGVPLVDFSILGDLGKVYDESRRRAQREAILSSIPLDASTQSLGTLGLQLIRAGDAEGGIPLARLGDAALRDARDFDWRRQEAGRAQGNTDRILALKERLAAAPRGLVYRGADGLAAPRSVGAVPPPAAVLALKTAPEQLRDDFNAKYGDGAADSHIGVA